MPRLSIIIPHRHNDQRLESTILSVLENRPEDSEIIVVHDGSYSDPYQLSDELLYVEGAPGASCLQLLNAGVMAACSPIVSTVLDGVSIASGWADEPLELLSEPTVAAVAVAIDRRDAQQTTYGIDQSCLRNGSELQRGRVEQVQATAASAGPQLSCGFYRKRVLLALGGWNERLDTSVADVDLAWALQALELACACAGNIQAVAEHHGDRVFTNAAMKQLAELAVAHGVSVGGATAAMADLLRGCLSGNIALAVAWASGIMSGRASDEVAARLDIAADQLERQGQPELKLYQNSGQHQRAYRRTAA